VSPHTLQDNAAATPNWTHGRIPRLTWRGPSALAGPTDCSLGAAGGGADRARDFCSNCRHGLGRAHCGRLASADPLRLCRLCDICCWRTTRHGGRSIHRRGRRRCWPRSSSLPTTRHRRRRRRRKHDGRDDQQACQQNRLGLIDSDGRERPERAHKKPRRSQSGAGQAEEKAVEKAHGRHSLCALGSLSSLFAQKTAAAQLLIDEPISDPTLAPPPGALPN
jgi:hypothetical protein